MRSNPLALAVLLGILSLLIGCPKGDDDDTSGDDDTGDDDTPDDYDSVDYVDPLIGAGGVGFGIAASFPGPAVPFGQVRPGPDTAMSSGAMPILHCGGYYYEDTHIKGFSHIHLHGVGAAEFGNIRFMPTLGIDEDTVDWKGHRSEFSHDTEVAEAGYYAVTLDDTDIRVELTATTHAAMQRYTYPESDEAVVFVDLSAALDGAIEIADVQLDPDGGELTGHVYNNDGFVGRVGGAHFHFVTRFDAVPTGWGTWSVDVDEVATLVDGGTEGEGERIGAWLSFATAEGEQVTLRTGISVIDLEHARANLDGEIGELTFDDVREEARDTGSMIGTPIDQMVAGSYLKGIRGYDVEAIADAMIDHASGWGMEGDRSCMEEYLTLGYVAMDGDCDKSVSRTLEFAYNDFGVAQLADALGRTAEAEALHEQSLSYENVRHPGQRRLRHPVVVVRLLGAGLLPDPGHRPVPHRQPDLHTRHGAPARGRPGDHRRRRVPRRALRPVRHPRRRAPGRTLAPPRPDRRRRRAGVRDGGGAVGLGGGRVLASGEAGRFVRHNLQRGQTLVAEGSIAGYAVAEGPLISLMMVDTEHQGRGLGTRLLRHMEDLLFPVHETLTLESFSANDRANRFYRSRPCSGPSGTIWSRTSRSRPGARPVRRSRASPSVTTGPRSTSSSTGSRSPISALPRSCSASRT